MNSAIYLAIARTQDELAALSTCVSLFAMSEKRDRGNNLLIICHAFEYWDYAVYPSCAILEGCAHAIRGSTMGQGSGHKSAHFTLLRWVLTSVYYRADTS
eukprot:8027620-Pyramimonas_sp.AAC.1